jgi:AraC-like DNA-binding protein
MPEGGSSIYMDADGYQAHVRDILDLLVLQPRDFHAQLTWADLRNFQLLRAREASPRVGYLTLPPDRVFVTFPTGQNSILCYGDVTLRFGDLMFHSRGERRHQRTTAACEWASIAVTPEALSSFSRTLSGHVLAAPTAGKVVRPHRTDARRLERLHSQVCQVVERNLNTIANREVARALEHDLIWALISCLANGKVQHESVEPARRADVLPSFEALLISEPHKLLKTREICAILTVSEATLRAKCSSALGLTPGHYQRLRRLKLVRAELLKRKPSTKGGIDEIILRFGFPNLHRFVAEYWDFYREMPPLPPVDPVDR